MIKIFDELTHSHYKNKDWPAMFRQKFRLRFTELEMSDSLNEIFKDPDLAKKFYRLDRQEVLLSMSQHEFYYPLTLRNLIYFCNHTSIKDKRITQITPPLLIEDLNSYSI